MTHAIIGRRLVAIVVRAGARARAPHAFGGTASHPESPSASRPRPLILPPWQASPRVASDPKRFGSSRRPVARARSRARPPPRAARDVVQPSAGSRSTLGERRVYGNVTRTIFGFSTPKRPTVTRASPVSLGSFSRQGAAPRGAVPSHGEPSARAGAAAREGQVVRLARFLSRIPFPDPPPTRPPRRSRHTRAARRHRADDLARRSRHPRAETDETRRASRP